MLSCFWQSSQGVYSCRYGCVKLTLHEVLAWHNSPTTARAASLAVGEKHWELKQDALEHGGLTDMAYVTVMTLMKASGSAVQLMVTFSFEQTMTFWSERIKKWRLWPNNQSLLSSFRIHDRIGLILSLTTAVSSYTCSLNAIFGDSLVTTQVYHIIKALVKLILTIVWLKTCTTSTWQFCGRILRLREPVRTVKCVSQSALFRAFGRAKI